MKMMTLGQITMAIIIILVAETMRIMMAPMQMSKVNDSHESFGLLQFLSGSHTDSLNCV